jgi:hypothetical protein
MGVVISDSSKVDATVRTILAVIARMRRLVRIDECEDLRLKLRLRSHLGWMSEQQKQIKSELERRKNA